MNNKQTIVCWNFKNGSNECFFENDKDINFLFQKDIIKRNFKKIRKCVFDQPFSKYFKIKEKFIGVDKVNPQDINLVIIPCLSEELLVFYIEKIPETIYDFCKQNNVTILVSYSREYPGLRTFVRINEQLEKYIIPRNISSKNFKILINGWQVEDDKYKNYYLATEIFDHLLRYFMEKEKRYFFFKPVVKKHYPFLKDRRYDFSVLTGNLIDRFERFQFLAQCDMEGLMDDRFFYSIICMDKEKTKSNLINYIIRNDASAPWDSSCIKLKEYFKSNEEKYLKHKVYDDKGNILKPNQHIYEDSYEFQIPQQMINSYVNVVLETRLYQPSFGEKIYKPILAGIPFLWMGPLGVLDKLKSMGYKPYSFINYDFEKEQSISGKREALVAEMKRLKKLNLSELVWKDKHIAKHNQLTFFKNTEYFDDFIKQLNESV